MINKFNIDKETLEDLYINKLMSTGQIAKLHNTTSSAVMYIMKSFNIPRRKPKRFVIDKETITELYITQKLTLKEIGNKYNTSQDTVKRILEKFGIPTRTRGESSHLSYTSGKSSRSVTRNPRWKGGRWQHKDGYIFVTIYSINDDEKVKFGSMFKGKSKAVQEHRLIVARKLGRPLIKEEEVHHINGIKYDNRDENLLLLDGHKHKDYIPALQRRIKELEDQINILKDK